MNQNPEPKHFIIELHDFEFLIGRWTVLNKRLKERLKTIQNGLNLWPQWKQNQFLMA